MVTAPRYAADPPGARIAVPLDALTAVYHRTSGATHLLASPSPELLAALGEGEADAATLIRRLALAYEMPDATPDALAGRLDELVAVGLVQRR